MRRLLGLLTALPLCAAANDFIHRELMLQSLERAVLTGHQPRHPFLTQLDLRREQGLFSGTAGLVRFAAPRVVASAYDPGVVYDLGDFYASSQQRLRLVVNQYLPGTRLVLSAGVDTGSQAAKISISRSFFFGVSGHAQLSQRWDLKFTSGAWQRQKVAERPCVDAFERQYWCPNLTAWTERPSLNFQPSHFLDLRLTYRF